MLSMLVFSHLYISVTYLRFTDPYLLLTEQQTVTVRDYLLTKTSWQGVLHC